MKLLWLTDIHLNFVKQDEASSFLRSICLQSPEAVIITGDIGEADSVTSYLRQFATELPCPVYCVLGNHDFYRGSIADVRAEISALSQEMPRLVYLTRSGVHSLTERTCLIGHDGWPDGRFGNFAGSQVLLNDFLLIRDFRRPNNSLSRLNPEVKAHWLGIMQHLADEAAAHLDACLAEALAQFDHVIVATHVPPFAQSSWHHGRPSHPDFLPFFSSKVTGDVLLAHADKHPSRRITVLCGHTHGGGEVEMRRNLRVLTGGAEYGAPAIQNTLPVD